METPNNFVFINCPFDNAYIPLFEAILFTTFACGFIPRCALEENDSGYPRLYKIIFLIDQCTLSLHDISRADLDGKTLLPRFNMPFELGLTLGRKHSGDKSFRPRMLVLDNQQYRYQKFLSDLAGCDISVHADEPQMAIAAVRNWLSHERKEVLTGPIHLNRWFTSYREAQPGICEELGLDPGNITFIDRTGVMNVWLQENIPLA